MLHYPLVNIIFPAIMTPITNYIKKEKIINRYVSVLPLNLQKSNIYKIKGSVNQ